MNESLEQSHYLEAAAETKRQSEYEIIFMRHGPRKEFEDQLTDEGRAASREFGKEVKFEKMAARHSGTKRTGDTIEEIYSTAPVANEDRLHTREKMLLDTRGLVSSTYLAEIRSFLRKGKEKEAVSFHLSHENKSYDDRTPTGREIASRVARLLKHYLGMSKHFKPDTKLAILNVSHDLVLLPFIAAVLQKIAGKNGEKRNFVEVFFETGGPLKPLEGISFKLVKNGREDLKLNFRGQEYPIDRGLIDEIAKYQKYDVGQIRN